VAYTDIDKPSDYFNTINYVGDEDNSGVQAQTGVGFQPDLVWVKNRQGAFGHIWVDSVRGVGQTLTSRSTAAEEDEAGTVEVFGSDGFTVGEVGVAAGGPAVNQDERNHVAWCWKAGTSFSNDASSTSIGTVDSSGSVNTDAGFSITKFTANGNNLTAAHGLGVAPKMIITKNRSIVKNWSVYHSSLGEGKAIFLNVIDVPDADNTYWNNTAPTSTTLSYGTWSGNNNGNEIIAYCFAEKQGYSKFGSYTGNGVNNNGAFFYLGFKPAFVIIKRTDVTNDWVIFDNVRDPINEVNESLYANTTAAGQTGTADDDIDFLSNGIKIREDNPGLNASGGTYIYMAFAENPFVTSTGIPATAR